MSEKRCLCTLRSRVRPTATSFDKIQKKANGRVSELHPYVRKAEPVKMGVADVS